MLAWAPMGAIIMSFELQASEVGRTQLLCQSVLQTL